MVKGETIQIKSLQTRETQSLVETKCVLPRDRGEARFYKESFCPITDPNLHSLIGPNSSPDYSELHVLIGHYGTALLGQ